ncbi:hypothetical protein VUR80DRAFT_7757 [Thermomyces stellatus]
MSCYWEDPSLFPMKGGCSCGYIRYTVSKAPIIVHCCHCTACQRETGSAFVLNAIVESSLVTLDPSSEPTIPGGPGSEPKLALPRLTADHHLRNDITGKPAPEEDDPFLKTPVAISAPDSPAPIMIPCPTESGRPQTIARCPRCATALWSHYHGGTGAHCAFIRVGTLDYAWKIQPDVHIYTRNKRDFISITDGKPQFEEFYPDKEAVTRPEGLQRYATIWPEVIASAKAASARR